MPPRLRKCGRTPDAEPGANLGTADIFSLGQGTIAQAEHFPAVVRELPLRTDIKVNMDQGPSG